MAEQTRNSGSSVVKNYMLCGLGMVLVLSLPISLGALYDELESRADKSRSDVELSLDDLLLKFGKGIVPCFIFVMSLMLFCLPTVVVLMSSLQIYAALAGEHGFSVISLIVTFLFGLVALFIQFLFASLFPVSLAQYSRGMHLKQSMHPLDNIGSVLEMGSEYWLKAAGWWLFLLGNTFLYIRGPVWYINLPLQILFATIGFASLVKSSRMALAFFQNQS